MIDSGSKLIQILDLLVKALTGISYQ